MDNIISWKKEGYKIGQDVVVVEKGMGIDTTLHKGKVISVGTKILKVDIGNSMLLSFKNKKSTNGIMLNYYTIYKSKDEYNQIVQAELDKEKMIAKIQSKLSNLSNEKLEAIVSIIDK